MHEYGTVILIFVAVLAGILFNRHDIGELKSDITKRLDKIDMRLDRIDEDLKQFHGTDKLLEGRVDELSKRIA